jgi:hypothetical protein
MARKHDLLGPKLKTWPLALLGVAVCLLVLMGIWVHDPSTSSTSRLRLADVRQREPARARSADERGSRAEELEGLERAPTSLPDAAPWVPEDESVATLELDFQMLAGLSSELARAGQRLPYVSLPGRSGQGSEEHGEPEQHAPEPGAPDSAPMASIQGGAPSAHMPATDAGARAVASLDGLERAASGASDEGAGSMLGTPAAPPGERCGLATCPAGGVCCNASCGTCVLPGETCSQLSCSVPRYPISMPCGRNTCAVGEICCNASCGTCTLPDETCAQAVCD